MAIRKARLAVSKRVRFEVFKRDQFTCQYCGGHPPAAVLHVDHIVAVAQGGGNDIDNLTTACSGCNPGKGAVSLTAIPESLKAKAQVIREQELQIKGYALAMRERRERLEEDAWRIIDVWDVAARDTGFRRDWFQSIRLFVDRLGVEEVFDAMNIAAIKFPSRDNYGFRYFCGICWAKIRMMEGAREIAKH